ncbi:MAG: hypothetical protein KIT58_00920 [Planctomycetota bacterium]|nr:hypothetical protein [Planctomycetota bacterium]
MSIADDLGTFYTLLSDLEKRVGGKRRLVDSHGRLNWPGRGVYFFFEPGEYRAGPGSDLRVVRVGTHAVSTGSRTTLWTRLRQHRGTGPTGEVGAGNHRGSIFRKHVGGALVEAGRIPHIESWGVGSSAPRETVDAEREHERAVSAAIGQMPFLWIEADDEPGPASVRATIEQGCIGLLCRARAQGLDAPSASWLGRHARAPEIRSNGLWNVDHVEKGYTPAVLDLLARLITATGRR